MNKFKLVVRKSLSAGRYLSLGLLLSVAIPTCAYEENSIDKEIVTTIEDKTQQDIDQELFEIFNKFFDEKDTTPFTKLVNKVISLLKLKKKTLDTDQQVTCDEVTKLLELNRHNYSIGTWGNILKNPKLWDLMSEQSQSYIQSIPNMKKLQTLIYKLKHTSHTFF